jgi:hypothetical protein
MNPSDHHNLGHMNTVTHVLLAGDRDYVPYLLEKRNTCLLEFPSGKLLDLTLDALAAASNVRDLVVIGPELLAPRIPRTIGGKSTFFLPQENSFSSNVYAALRWVQANRPGNSAVFVTNDAPLLTSAELDRFAAVVVNQDADINVAVARISPELLDDPLVSQYIRSIVTLSDGLYLLANQVALSSDAISVVRTLQRLFDLRKQSQFGTSIRTFCFVLREWRSVRAITTWLRAVLAKRAWLLFPDSRLVRRMSLPLQDVESSLERLLGYSLRVRINEISGALGCFDADTPHQLDELRKVVASDIELETKLETSHG